MIVAIIPARSGSKRFPNKNLYTLDGKTLLLRAVEFAREILVDQIIVTTDYPHRVLQEASSFCTDVTYHHRSVLASSDHATDLDVIKDLLGGNVLTVDSDFVWIRPTSPYRCPNECNSAISKYLEMKETSAIQSLRSISPTRDHPFYIKRMNTKGLLDSITEYDEYQYPRSQDLPVYFSFNSQFDISSVAASVTSGAAFPKPIYGFLTRSRGIDIDFPSDLTVANHNG